MLKKLALSNLLVIVILTSCLIVLINNAFANSKKCNDHDIQEINSYLNSFKSLQAQFVQYDDSLNQKTQEGVLYIAKPGKLKWSYNKPKKHSITINNETIGYYDDNLQEMTYIPKSYFLKSLKLLSNSNIDLTKNLSLRACLKENDLMKLVIFEDVNNSDAGGLMLILNRSNSIQIKEMMILNQESIITSKIVFSKVQYNKEFGKSTFMIEDQSFLAN